MKFKHILLLIIILILTSQNSYATVDTLVYTDVVEGQWFYEDVTYLSGLGIINGYEDYTFRPDNTITVAEFLKLALVATDQPLQPGTTTQWYSTYVTTAIELGLFDTNTFADYNRPITRAEISMVVAQLLELNNSDTSLYINQIRDYNMIPEAYVNTSLQVYIAGIVTGYEDQTILPNNPASRSEASVIIVRMLNNERRVVPEPIGLLTISKGYSVQNIEINMTESYLESIKGSPTEIVLGQFGLEWWVYANDYDNFLIVGIQNGLIKSLFANQAFSSETGISIGSSQSSIEKIHSGNVSQDAFKTTYDGMQIAFYLDLVDNDGVEAIWIKDSSLSTRSTYETPVIDGMEKMVFYLVNATRAKFGQPTLIWSDLASLSGYIHSKDMADNDYFSHTNLEGQEPWDRMVDVGIDYYYAAENLSGGYNTPFDIHFGLMNSPGHRVNILSPNPSHLGVGIYYDYNSTYRIYTTENYYQE